MNYIEEDIGFEQWCEHNYLPILSQVIWKKLFKRFNRSGWREWISVDNLTLMADCQMRSEKTFINFRNKLIGYGLIEFEKGKKGVPNKYKLLSFEKNTVLDTVQMPVKSIVKTPVKTTVEETDLKDKHKQNKNKDIGWQTPDITQKSSDALEAQPMQCGNVKMIEGEVDVDVNAKKATTQNQRFVVPTVDEVTKYCIEHGNKVDTGRFVDFYESKGWMVGKNKMKDWKAAVRNWERMDTRSISERPVIKPSKFVNFEQRGFDFEKIEKQERSRLLCDR